MSGIFTLPVPGAWRVTYSLWSQVDSGDFNFAWLLLNGKKFLSESVHRTSSKSCKVDSTGGRMVILEASAGETIELRTTRMDLNWQYIYFCAEYIAKT